MKSKNSYILCVLCFFSLHSMAENLSTEADLNKEASDIVKTFGGMLKPKLKQAIQSGGLEHAIKVCSVEAPKIAVFLSAETGWSIKRVSLKPRNVRSALPDTFEKMVLDKFNEAQEEGVSSTPLEYSEIVDNKFRFMKAQAVEGICLNCHGNSIPADTKKMLNEYYPEDLAIGYSMGEIRGAFSLIKEL